MQPANVRRFYPTLEPVLQSWFASRDLHNWKRPATPEQLHAAERVLGRPIPGMLRAIYEVTNGLSLLGGNLELQELGGDAIMSFPSASDELRKRGWLLPPEVHVFAGDGSDSLFGLWLDETDNDSPPVVEIGSIFGHGCMSVAGTTLDCFLRRWTAYYLLVCEAPASALDALKLPSDLRVSEADDALVIKLCAWADPELPTVAPDPYRDRLTPDDIRQLFSSRK